VLDALVDRKNGKVTGAGEAPVVEERLEAAQNLRVAVGHAIGPVDIVRTGKVKGFFRNLGFMLEERLGVCPEKGLDIHRRFA
jgi:hypothetical protein